MTQPQDPGDLARRDARVFLSQSGSSPVACAIVAAEGPRIRDDAGRWLYDLHGNGCHHLGYGHPRLMAAAIRQMRTLPFAPRRFTNAPAVALAEALVARWPGGEGRVLFAPSGTDAIEIALKLARLATGRFGTLAFDGAWHGAGFGALSAGGRARERPDRLGPLVPGAAHVPGPDLWAGPEARERSASATLEAVRAALTPIIGCLIAQPISEGVAPPPPWFWPELRRLCDACGALLIFDEIPRGLGRAGTVFASERVGVSPDVTVLGKALGGALVPLAAVIARADLDVAADLAIGHVTHEKSALGCAVGLEVLATIEEEGLLARAEAIGARLEAALAPLARPGGPLARAGRIGAMVSLELADRGATGAVVAAAYAAGLNLTASAGRAALAPPLILTDAETDDVAARLAAALEGSQNAQPQQPIGEYNAMT